MSLVKFKTVPDCGAQLVATASEVRNHEAEPAPNSVRSRRCAGMLSPAPIFNWDREGTFSQKTFRSPDLARMFTPRAL